MPKSIFAASNENAKEPCRVVSTTLNKINEFESRLETALACSGGKDRKELIIDEDIIKVAKFVVENADILIKEAAPGITNGDLESIRSRITDLDTIVAASLLFTMRKTHNIDVLASEKFLESAKILDNHSFSSLLYIVKISEQIATSTNQTVDAVFASLTDGRLFTKEVAEFSSKLSVDAVSQWFYSTAMTGKVAALTSEGAMSRNMLDATGGDSNIVGKLSLAIGMAVAPGALTSPKFLESFGSLDRNDQDKLLSKVISTGNADLLTSSEAISRIRNGDPNVWADIARISNAEVHAGMPTRILVVGIGDKTHNLGSVLFTRSLWGKGAVADFLDDAKNVQDITNYAKRIGASAIVFSIMGKGSNKNINEGELLQMVTDTSEKVKAQGIAVLGGGLIEQSTAKMLQQAGVTMFEQGKTASESAGNVMGYLNNSTLRHPQQLTYAGRDSRLIGVSASNTSSRVYAPITVSAILNVGRHEQVASYLSMTNSQTAINARCEQSFTSTTSDSEEESKKRRKTLFNPKMNVDRRRHTNGINGILIRAEVPIIADTSTNNRIVVSSTIITSTLPMKTMVMQAIVSNPLLVTIKVATAQTRREAFTFTTAPINLHLKADIPGFKHTGTSWEAVCYVGVPTNTPTKTEHITMPIKRQNDAIVATLVTTSPLIYIPLAPSLVTMRTDLLDSKRINIITVTFAESVKFARPRLQASTVSNQNQQQRASNILHPQQTHHKNSAAVQPQTTAKQPVAGRKGLKLSIPIHRHMKIFEKAIDKFRKFNIARKEKKLEKLLARSREFVDKLETEAKRLGIDLRRLKTGNYYEALGIKYTTDHKIIKEAYHGLVKRHHPDVSKDINAEETTKKINEAYAVLKDRKLKEEYDKNFSKGKNRISADATRSLSEELMKQYKEARDKDFKEFGEITSVPLQRDTLRAAIEEVCDWNKRFNKAASATFGNFRDYGNKIKKLDSINKRLLQKEAGETTLAKLRENGRRLDELITIYGEIDNGISVVTGNVRKEIGSQESRITKKLRALA